MRDPFKPNSNKQLIREAQVGFTVIGLLVATLIYVAWFRLNGEVRTPDHIRDAPIAMQVFPNSPNYDRETHTMRSPDRQLASDVTSFATQPVVKNLTPRQNTKPNPALVTVPKRVMEDSNRTARSLQEAAESIKQSATRVATLTSPPTTEKPFGLVSNPAANGESRSGFKVLKNLELDVNATEPSVVPSGKLQFSNDMESHVAKAAKADSPVKQSSTAIRFNSGKGFGSTPDEESTSRSMPSNDQPIETKAANDFKPLAVTPLLNLLPQPSTMTNPAPLKKAESIKNAAGEAAANKPETSNEFKVDDFNGSKPANPKLAPPKPFGSFYAPEKADDQDATIPRLPKLPEQSLDDLRPLKSPTEPSIKTVSYEDATWEVKKGDSYWSIAQATYGDGRFFRALYEQNRQPVPGFEDLTEGVSLVLPTAEQLVKRYPELCPSDAVRKNDPWRETPDDLMEKLTDDCERDLNQRLYETKAGDTLFNVARRQLGQASRYVELIDLNKFRIDENVTHESELPPGIQLLLPQE